MESTPRAQAPFSERVRALNQKPLPVCLGIDPHPYAWPAFMQAELRQKGLPAMIARWGQKVIEVAATTLPAIKVQSAMFEALGAEGFAVMKGLIAQAKAQNLLVILDAKRGDIASTMASYGSMCFDYFKADALTVTPYLGFDALLALKPWLVRGYGAYVVWLSSNSEGAFLQNFTGTFAGKEKSFVAFLLEHFLERSAQEGLDSSWGLVLGANQLDQVPAALWPKVLSLPLLLPGLGAQGAAPSAAKLEKLKNEGLPLFPISRSLTGVGELNHQSLWASCKSFDDYQSVLKAQIDLWQACHKKIPSVSKLPQTGTGSSL